VRLRSILRMRICTGSGWLKKEPIQQFTSNPADYHDTKIA
jgi:hypothetical protein